MFETLSDLLGVPEAAVRLLASILLGFPLALLHRNTLYGKEPDWQHVFFILSGFTMGYWNYEWDIMHSAYALCFTYLILRFFGGTDFSVIVTFVFNMVYLLVGYYLTSTENYDIKWTMAQCVLALRLIGLAFDLSDGKKPEDKLSVNQKATVLRESPSFLEMAAFTYFPGSFLVGPQFNMRRYLDYVNGKLRDPDAIDELPPCLTPGIIRASTGFVYIALFQIGSWYVPDDYLLDPEYASSSFVKRWMILGLWGRVNLYKYISVWLISEGVCTAFGITYNGREPNGITGIGERTIGNIKWDGCANVKLWLFENAQSFDDYIQSFNTNTNHWCAEYIYKRLRFLGSKLYSQIATLLFLAIWHGFHSGYYLCFFMEFLIMYLEKDLGPVLGSNEKLQTMLKNPAVAVLKWSILKVYTFVFMGYSLIPFVHFSYPKYIQVFSAISFLGHILFLSYALLAPFLKPYLQQRRPRPHIN